MRMARIITRGSRRREFGYPGGMRWLLLISLLGGCQARAAPPPREWRGDVCHDDAGCRWDDPCHPARCVGAASPSPSPARSCDAASPPPGTCACVEEMCTLRPAEPAYGVSEGACRKDDECAVDVAAGTCHAGGETLIGPIHEQGPVCACDRAAGRCRLEWVEPVRCKSWRDCSWVAKPRLRPVPSTKVRRPVRRPVRPCKDAEVDSVCTPEGTCRIVGWSC